MKNEDNMQLRWVLCNRTSLSGVADDLRTMLVPGLCIGDALDARRPWPWCLRA